MTLDLLKQLEDRLSVIEFKLELVLKLTKLDINLSLEDCKTMNELAFVSEINKSEFNAINDLLKSQIKFFQSCKKNTYGNSRPIVKFDPEVDVFSAFSKDEYEKKIWEYVPKLNGNTEVCEKIARINGIYEMYYDQFADEIKKTKRERLDYETKLSTSYKENRKLVDQAYQDVLAIKKVLEENIKHVDTMIKFFVDNEIVKISIFYNSILWDKKNDDKKVVIDENSYIFNVCITNHSDVLEQVNNIQKDKKHECSLLFNFLLESDATSSTSINKLHDLYKKMVQLNKNEYVLLVDILNLKEELNDKIKLIDYIYNVYQEYVNSL